MIRTRNRSRMLARIRARRCRMVPLLALVLLVSGTVLAPPATARPAALSSPAPFRAAPAALPALPVLAAVPTDDPPQPNGQAYPSTGDIDRARADAARRAAAASAIEARLADARTELEQAGQRAEQAVEAYNGAQARLTRARAASAAAAVRAATAESARVDAAERAAALAAATYRTGATPELSAFNDLFTVRGPRAAAEQSAAVGAAGRTTRQILDEATSTARAAADAQRAAQADAAAAERAAGAVARAKAEAQAQLTAHQQTVTELGERRERLLGELAAARNTTVELERRRQAALEAIAAQQAEAAAKAAALAAEKAAAEKAAEEKAAAEKAAADKAAADKAAADKAVADKAAAEEAAQQSEDAPDQPQQAAPPPAPSSESGGQAAVAYARARLGLPYVWGGEGPGGYDCSGLTKLAWQQSGRRLTHFAADQYAESTPVTYHQLRPGDLVFWSHTGKPADIYHVAIYLGDDQVIMAPHPGGTIEQTSLWVMGGPTSYARP
ncbi:C40 family peptidase [Kitasatospora sp. GP30]|uniref:C40 family peptidase n=1 Tax=Kitasatospora sp. GP30 TaxID=3035084 RepID=UPI000C70E7F1|nr:C40 family peptidase [Kitasatospora sp. GP30]